ncbi:MAG: hypothetical protein SGARI_000629 [Bacillariaceae sp.]
MKPKSVYFARAHEWSTQTDFGGLLESGKETSRLAQELVELSNATQEKDRSLMNFAKAEGDGCRGLGDANVLKPGIFHKLVDLVDDNKISDTIQTVKAMKENTHQCLDKSVELSKSIQTSIDCLPEDMKQIEDKPDGDVSEEEEEVEEEQGMLDLEQEISDLKECTDGIRSMNIFNAAHKGTKGFVGLAKECQFLDDMFDRMKELSSKVAEISQSFMVESCCAQVVAGVSSLSDLKRCLKLSTVITKFADASKRLVDAILEMVEAIKAAFAQFIPQFEAAKKIKNSPVVKFGSSVVSKFSRK